MQEIKRQSRLFAIFSYEENNAETRKQPAMEYGAFLLLGVQ